MENWTACYKNTDSDIFADFFDFFYNDKILKINYL